MCDRFRRHSTLPENHTEGKQEKGGPGIRRGLRCRGFSVAGLLLAVFSLCFSWLSLFNLFLILAAIFAYTGFGGKKSTDAGPLPLINLVLTAASFLLTAFFTVYYLQSV